jgi:hypothetical protein
MNSMTLLAKVFMNSMVVRGEKHRFTVLDELVVQD